MKEHFIKTTDKTTADKLTQEGFKLVSRSGPLYIFLNEIPKNFKFEEIDKRQITFSNILSV